MNALARMLLASLLISPTLSAQKDPHLELRAGYGVLSAPSMGAILSSSLIGGLTGYEKGIIQSTGAIMVSALSNPANRLSWGIDLGWEQLDITYESPGRPDLKTKDRYISIMPRADFKFLRKENLKLYSSAALGASFLTNKQNNSNTVANATSFAFHFSPIGIKAGNTFGFFAELGFGFRGLANAGISVKM